MCISLLALLNSGIKFNGFSWNNKYSYSYSPLSCLPHDGFHRLPLQSWCWAWHFSCGPDLALALKSAYQRIGSNLPTVPCEYCFSPFYAVTQSVEYLFNTQDLHRSCVVLFPCSTHLSFCSEPRGSRSFIILECSVGFRESLRGSWHFTPSIFLMVANYKLGYCGPPLGLSSSNQEVVSDGWQHWEDELLVQRVIQG